MFETTKTIIKMPTHLNILDGVKCIGYFMLTVIVITCKLIGLTVKVVLKVVAFMLRNVAKGITWLLSKLDK